jgi:thiosulfate/3-mercaptopyruvate sulfurtransferase
MRILTRRGRGLSAARAAALIVAFGWSARAATVEFVSTQRATVWVSAGSTQVVDARSAAKYLAGHIPGAVNVRDEQVRASRGRLPTAMLDGKALGELFGASGIDSVRPVLVYADGDDPLAATLIAYALVKAGHPRVGVLDGGFSAWQGAGSVTQDLTDAPPVAWGAAPDESMIATLEDVRAAVRTEEVALIDARPAKFFRGETRAWKRNGHVPGAVNLDWHAIVAADNESLLRPASEIARLAEGLGASGREPAIVYCGTGREATLLFLSLRSLLGWTNVRLFEGSWTEYQADPQLPVATGATERGRIENDGEMSMGGQPSADQVRELADRGFKLIVNCRAGAETRAIDYPEKTLAESLGMRYVEIPLGGSDGYSPEAVAALDAVLREHGGAKGVHMHCAGGGRAATLWAAYLVKARGVEPAEAMARVRATGLLRESGFERLVGEPLRLERSGR